MGRGRMVETADDWMEASERFLAAAGALPPADAMHQPRAHLLALAVECRLKAYLLAARGGVPGTDDLTRLATLAAHCGLDLSCEFRDGLARLARSQWDPGATPVSEEWVRDLCGSIAVQAAKQGR